MLGDCPGHADYVKNMITGALPRWTARSGRVCSDGPMPQTRDILLARQVGVHYIVVFLNKTIMMDDESCWSWSRWRSTRAAGSYGFPGDEILR